MNKGDDTKRRNPYTKILRDPNGPFNKRVEKSKKTYTRKKKHKDVGNE